MQPWQEMTRLMQTQYVSSSVNECMPLTLAGRGTACCEIRDAFEVSGLYLRSQSAAHDASAAPTHSSTQPYLSDGFDEHTRTSKTCPVCHITVGQACADHLTLQHTCRMHAARHATRLSAVAAGVHLPSHPSTQGPP